MKLVIFDCDGVLVDSEMILNQIDAKALTDLGYSVTADECIERFTGMNYKTCFEIIHKESGILIPDNFFEITRLAIQETFEKELRPLIPSVLQNLEKMHICRCVASSSPKKRVINCLQITDQFRYFNESTIFTSEQVKNGKPAPDLFQLAAREMGFHKDDCIVVEDSPAGIEAALAAGMQAIGFLAGTHTLHDRYQKRIKAYGIPVAESADELLSILRL